MNEGHFNDGFPSFKMILRNGGGMMALKLTIPRFFLSLLGSLIDVFASKLTRDEFMPKK